MVQQLITPTCQVLDIHYTYNNNQSNEFDRNYFALKFIVKYIILLKKILCTYLLKL